MCFYNELLEIVGMQPTLCPSSVVGSRMTESNQTASIPSSDSVTEGDGSQDVPCDESTGDVAVDCSTADTTSKKGKSKARKRKGRRDDVIVWLEEYSSKRQNDDQDKLRMMAEMHKDKLERMDRLVDVLQSFTKK